MLALTTNRGPRNLLIDFAFFGLSTITSDRPPRPAGAASAASTRLGVADFDRAAVVALRVRVVPDAALGLVVEDFADLRATGCVPDVIEILHFRRSTARDGPAEPRLVVVVDVAFGAGPGTL